MGHAPGSRFIVYGSIGASLVGVFTSACSNKSGVEARPSVAPLTATRTDTLDVLGWSIGTSGNTAVLGSMFEEIPGTSHGGQAHVLIRAVDGTWTEQAQLVMGDPVVNSFFGISSAIDGDTIAVGATHGTDSLDTPDAGAVYVYTRSGTVWTQQAKLSELDGGVFKSYGYSVSLDGNTLAVGSRFNDHSELMDAGAVYVYVRSGATWSLQQKILAPNPNNYDVFGFSSALEGDVLAVGCYQHDGLGDADIGAVDIYRRSGGVWTFEQELTAPDAVAGDRLGFAVAMRGDLVVAGMPGATRGGVEGRGGFHTFRHVGGTWRSEGTTLFTGALVREGAGDSIRFNGSVLAVGASTAPVDGVTDAGLLHLLSPTLAGGWQHEAMLREPVAVTGHLFGFAVGLLDTSVIVSAPAPSEPLAHSFIYEVEASVSLDAGVPDAGPPDAGPPDAGPPDAGPPDAGPPDAGPPDAGPPDAGPPDAGPPDAGPPDAGPPDAGPPDAGPPDAGPPDAGPPDTGPPDAGVVVVVDAGPVLDSGVADSGAATDAAITLDAASEDSSVALDSGLLDAGPAEDDATVADTRPAHVDARVDTDAGTDAKKKKKGCAVAFAGGPARGSLAWLSVSVLGAVFVRGRRKASQRKASR